MTAVFVEAETHKGTSLIEILQNCLIFNDKVFSNVTDKSVKLDMQLWLEHGQPMIFGANKNKGLILNGFHLEIVTIGENGVTEADILVHDAHCEDSTMHSMLIRMHAPNFPVAFGVIRKVECETFDANLWKQIDEVKENAKINSVDELMNSGVTWEIE